MAGRNTPSCCITQTIFAILWSCRPFFSFSLCRYGHNAKVVHFLGKVKPWNYSYDAQKGEVKGHSQVPDEGQLQSDYLRAWWKLYAKSVVPLLQKAYKDAPFVSGFVESSSEVGATETCAWGWERSVRCTCLEWSIVMNICLSVAACCIILTSWLCWNLCC